MGWTYKKFKDSPGQQYLAYFTPDFVGNIVGPTDYFLGPCIVPMLSTGLLARRVWVANFTAWPFASREDALAAWNGGWHVQAFLRRCDAKRWIEWMAVQAEEARARLRK